MVRWPAPGARLWSPALRPSGIRRIATGTGAEIRDSRKVPEQLQALNCSGPSSAPPTCSCRFLPRTRRRNDQLSALRLERRQASLKMADHGPEPSWCAAQESNLKPGDQEFAPRVRARQREIRRKDGVVLSLHVAASLYLRSSQGWRSRSCPPGVCTGGPGIGERISGICL